MFLLIISSLLHALEMDTISQSHVYERYKRRPEDEDDIIVAAHGQPQPQMDGKLGTCSSRVAMACFAAALFILSILCVHRFKVNGHVRCVMRVGHTPKHSGQCALCWAEFEYVAASECRQQRSYGLLIFTVKSEEIVMTAVISLSFSEMATGFNGIAQTTFVFIPKGFYSA
uniref:Uncharacterized protein n=1 Tax=Glossina austeni TaxID=7395 RepID=A0A1A9UWB9_GLOAU